MKKAALILSIFLIPVIIIVLLAVFQGGSTVTPPAKLTLQVWGTKPTQYFNEVIAAYTATKPYITILYKQIPEETYRQQLVDAWALNQGPDVFEYPAQQMLSYQQFLTPAPASTPTYTYEKIKRFGVKEEIIVTKEDVPGPTAATVRQDFVDTVSADAVYNNGVYGLPLSIDSLVLYSNRDLLNQARIPLPATSWDQFVQQVPRMTVLDTQSNLVQAGASIGTSVNIDHADDILALLILQNGGRIINPNGVQSSISSPQAEQATEFYTDFARPSKIVYTWNDKQGQALNEFASGKVAYYLGFAADDELINQRSTGLNYDMSEAPQVNTQQPLNVANYSLYGVYTGAPDTAASWNFLQFMTGNDGGIYYHNRSLEVPARKGLINTLLTTPTTDPQLIMRAGQALTAQSWYRGNDEEKAEEIMVDIITRSISESTSISEVLRDATEEFRFTLL